MTDRELLELAAKAAQYEISAHQNRKINRDLLFILGGKNWNPLNDDAAAFQLMVELELFDIDECLVNLAIKENDSQHINKSKATRRAIVMAAAEIGKAI